MRSTEQSDTMHWVNMWLRATCVWSYYDLFELMAQDQLELAALNFYHAPLGVSPVFAFRESTYSSRNYTILTSGYIAESECVIECSNAAAEVKGSVLHLGPKLPFVKATFAENVSDSTLVHMYRSVLYVAGLRRVEGFELPAAEGLICGARPIMFDRPHYRKWFDPWAIFIEEGPADFVQEQLVAVFRRPYRPVELREVALAADQFSWPKICKGFWETVQVGLGELV
jgi:hypothetical protein